MDFRDLCLRKGPERTSGENMSESVENMPIFEENMSESEKKMPVSEKNMFEFKEIQLNLKKDF